MKRIREVNWVFFITVIVLLCAGFIPFSKLNLNDTERVLISQAILALPSIVYLIKRKESYKKVVSFKKVRPANVVLLVILTFCIMPIMSFVNAFSMMYTTNITTSMMTNVTGDNSLLISVLCIALVPAFLEETVYRGIFYQEYRRVNPFAAMFLSAVMFGLLHGNLNQFSYAFVMGLIFAFIIEATDSILSTMIIHFIINANSTIIISLLPKLLDYLKTTYEQAAANGDTKLTELITSITRTNNFDANELLNTAGEAIKMDLGTVLRSYGIAALIGGFLAFIVYRTIAINSGRWEHVKSLFHKQQQAETYNTNPYVQNILGEVNDEGGEEYTKRTMREILTAPLTIALVILVINIILTELMLRGYLK